MGRAPPTHSRQQTAHSTARIYSLPCHPTHDTLKSPPHPPRTSYDATTKHVVGTARFTVNYAIATTLATQVIGNPDFGKDKAAFTALCERGVNFLHERHVDQEHGGLSWVLQGHTIADGTKWCYSVAFGLLALSAAHNVGIAAAKGPLATLLTLAEETFYEKEHGR